jgi:hypothetical protein
MDSFRSNLRRLSIGTDTVLATNPYAATSNTKQCRNDLHHGFVYAHQPRGILQHRSFRVSTDMAILYVATQAQRLQFL